MKVENQINPNQEQIAGFSEPGPDGPIYMVNLLKYKAKAEYEDGRETELTGEEAYRIYAEGVQNCLAEVGGKVVFKKARVSRLTIGEVKDLWDAVAIVMYPSRKAMFEMVMSDSMAAISIHRKAGLEGQLNLETTVDP